MSLEDSPGVEVHPMPEIQTATFLGKSFRVGYARVPGKCGGCTARNDKTPVVFIDDRLEGGQLLEVAIHEAIHACFDGKLKERKVLSAGKDIARFARRIMEQWQRSRQASKQVKE